VLSLSKHCVAAQPARFRAALRQAQGERGWLALYTC